MVSFLKSVFGEDIRLSRCEYPSKAPLYFQDMYELHLLSWGENKCLVLSPRSSSWRLPTLKTHIKRFQSLCDLPCALSLENLTSEQRQSLIADKIPFVSVSQQVYFPFWGSSFCEKFKAKVDTKRKMAPGTQMVFLYLYYAENAAPINLTQISKKLSLSKATCTRAISDLAASGLITQRENGTNKWISPAFKKCEFLRKGYVRLKSPIERVIYLKMPPQNKDSLLSGIKALAKKTVLGSDENDGAIALSKKDVMLLPKDIICNKQYFDDFGGTIIEVWTYNPLIFAEKGCVDDISLLLSLEDAQNERVQMCLDFIRKKHGLPITEEE